MQLAISILTDRTVICLENNRSLVGVTVIEMTVEAVVGNIQLAVIKPFIERCLRLVEHAGKRLLPMKVLVGQPTPKTLVILIRFTAKREVCVHP